MACPASRQAPRPACRARKSGNVCYSSESHDPDFWLFGEDLAFDPLELADLPVVPEVSLDLASLLDESLLDESLLAASLAGLAAASSALAALL